MPSALVLGLVANGAAQAPRPSCAAMLNQPCRAVTGTVPSGQLTLRGQTKGSRKSRGRRAFR
jgi:hypothetical protein